jgi:hypothetical protein
MASSLLCRLWVADYVAAFRFEVNKDQYFDQAMELVNKADKIAPNNSEITALKGYVIMGKLSVDPMSRGQEMSPLAMQTFGKAIALDKENPRATTLMAQMELGMSQFFGSGPVKSLRTGKGRFGAICKRRSQNQRKLHPPNLGQKRS